MNWKKRASQLFRIGVSLILIVWLWRMADQSHLVSSLVGANLWIIALTFIPANFDRIFMAYKWNLLLKAKGILIPLWDVIGIYFRASFWGSILLPTVGADALRIFEVSRETKKTDDVISSVVIERFLGIAAVLVAGSLGFVLFTLQVDQRGLTNLLKLVAGLIIGMALFLLSLRLEKIAFLVKRFRIYHWPFVQKLRKIYASYRDYSLHRRTLFLFFLLSIVEQYEPAVASYIISRAFHLDIPVVYFLVFIPIIMMIIRLPISFDGFGVREGLYVYFFGLVGIPSSSAFLVGFITSLVSRFLTMPLTLYFFWRQKPAADAKISVEQPQLALENEPLKEE